MSDDKVKGKEALNEIGARLGDLFGAVRSAIDEIGKSGEVGRDAGAQDGRKDFTVDVGEGPIRATAGWRVRVGGLAGDADASNADFSSDPIKTASRDQTKPDTAAARECLVEVFDEADAWIMTAELPGVDAADLRVALEDGAVLVETSGARRYVHREAIPAALWSTLDQDGLESRLANGILEIRLPKRA